MSSTTSSPGKRGIKPRFTREEVIAAAVELIDAEPAEAFTMKRLADHLGIGVMTLYGYVAGKEDLLEGVAASMFESVGAPDAAAPTWEEELRRQARGIYEIVLRHPNLAPALRAQSSPNPSLFRVRERMLNVLRGAGFDRAGAVRAMGIITGYAQGFASVQGASLDPGTLPGRVRQLPRGDFPQLHDLAEVYPSHLSAESFEDGLDLLIAGLRARFSP